MSKMAADFYERYGLNWSEPARRIAERRATEYKVDRLAFLMDGVRPKSIIDFGCGLGDALNLLVERFQPAGPSALTFRQLCWRRRGRLIQTVNSFTAA